MLKEKYFDKKPKHFKVFIITLFVVIMFILVLDAYRNATTVFTGTHYMRRPSNYYTVKELPVYSTENTSPTPEKIGIGSFLLSVEGTSADSIKSLKEFLSGHKKELVKITIFNIGKAGILKDMWEKQMFMKLADTVYVKRAELMNETNFRYLESGVFIGFVIPDGATSKAGIEPGDLLISIKDTEIKLIGTTNEGESFTMESLRYLRSLPLNENIPFKILRKNNYFIINVELSTFGIRTNHLMVIIIGILMAMTALFFGLKKPESKAARLVGIAFLITCLQMILSVNYNPPGYDFTAFIKIYFANILGLSVLPLLFHSLLYFPVLSAFTEKRRRVIYIPYALGILSSLIFTYYYFFDLESLKPMIYSIINIVMIVYYIAERISERADLTSEEKKLSRLVKYPMLLVLLYAVSFDLGIKLPEWYRTYAFVIIVIVPLVYLLALRKTNSTGIKISLRRNIQYNFLSVFWFIVTAGIFVATIFILSKINLNIPIIEFSSTYVRFASPELNSEYGRIAGNIVLIVFAFIAGYINIQLYREGIKYFNRIFYREKLDYKKAQSELISLIYKTITLDKLGKLIARKLPELVKLKKSGIIFLTSVNQWGNKIVCMESLDSESVVINLDERMVECLSKIKSSLSVTEANKCITEFMEKQQYHYLIPIVTKEKILGIIFIGEKLSETSIKPEDIDFIESLASNIAIAIENSVLHEELTAQERIKKELEVARKIQLESLPQKVPNTPGLDIFAVSLPALEVGGDFYDFLNGTDDKLTVIMGDVSGKGTSAALYMSKVQGIFQTLNEFNLSPGKLLMRANKLLYKHIDSKSYITAIGASIYPSEKVIKYARAGHLPLYKIDKEGKEVIKIQPGGIGLGLSSDEKFETSLEEILIKYTDGESFVFISDGVTESMNKSGEQFGEERLYESIIKYSGMKANEICAGLLDDISVFSVDTKQYDDITIVIVNTNSIG
jgi:serine phosphatase RsbU (regulator of sigma subunit)